MIEFFRLITDLPAPFSMVVFIVLVGATAGTISHLATEVRKYCSHKEELDLKRELVDRGMASDEIDLVMRSGSADRERAA